jgi:hypothetical protein
MDLAQFIYLGPGEKIDTSSFIYFIVFGRLNVKIHGVPKRHQVNVGWTLGEEVLFSQNQGGSALADVEAISDSCLL